MRDLCELSFYLVGLRWHDHMVVDPALARPAEVDLLQGDASKAKRVLGWSPKVSIPDLVATMSRLTWPG